MKTLSILPRYPEMKPFHQIQFSVILKTSFLIGDLTSMQRIQSAYTKPCRKKPFHQIQFSVILKTSFLIGDLTSMQRIQSAYTKLRRKSEVCIYPTPPPLVDCYTRSICKWSKASFDSEFFFSEVKEQQGLQNTPAASLQRGKTSTTNVLDLTLNHLIVRSSLGIWGNLVYLFIAIAPRSTLIRCAST